MQMEVAKAQASSLRQWAAAWRNEAVPGDGKASVADSLERAARMIERVVAGEAPEESEVKLSVVPPATELREG